MHIFYIFFYYPYVVWMSPEAMHSLTALGARAVFTNKCLSSKMSAGPVVQTHRSYFMLQNKHKIK